MIGPTIYTFGSPMEHAFHGRWGASMGSLALRVALPDESRLIKATRACS